MRLPPHDDATAAGSSATRTFTLDDVGREFPSPYIPGLVLPSRYEDRGFLGSGAMGEVRRVFDRTLETLVAMKVLRPEAGSLQAVKARFELEARVTARLRHPAIVAVHDTGTLADGRLWFTMEIVEGRTLKELIEAVHDARSAWSWRSTRDGWSLRRLLRAFVTVCDAVALAHSRGVIHRDLKPRNVMVGAHGEVKVMDWGIARGADFDLAAEREAFAVLPSEHRTAFGRVVGTPAYMSPEQARGERTLTATSDVYALGAVLYHILAGKAIFEGTPESVLRQAAEDRPRPLYEALGPQAPAPPFGLLPVLERALAADPADRFPDAGELASALRGWFQRDERRESAGNILAKVQDRQRELERLLSEEQALRAAAVAALGALPAASPIAAKVPGWQLEDLARSRRIEVDRGRVEVEEGLWAALATAPEDPDIRAAVGKEQVAALIRAEDAGDEDDADDRVAWIRDFGLPAPASVSSGLVHVDIEVDPPDAKVEVLRSVWQGGPRSWEVDRVLPTGRLQVTLPAGSWLFRLSAPGHETVLFPALLHRSRPFVLAGPGDRNQRVLRLPRSGTVPAGCVYVPPSWTYVGDLEAPGGFSRRRIWVDGYVIGRFPVTVSEWMTSARARWSAGPLQAEDIDLGSGVSSMLEVRWESARGPYLHVGADYSPSEVTLHPALVRSMAAVGGFLRWLSSRDGLPWRLPDEIEWEMAASGVDGSRYPWGPLFDPAFAHVLGSQERPSLLPVGAYPLNQSVYGVRDQIGGFHEATSTAWGRPPPESGTALLPSNDLPHHAIYKGASYVVGEPYTRAGARAKRPASTLRTFRIACSWAPS
jgi:serine/threonine-protein kinase